MPEATTIEAGQNAPAFRLRDQGGQEISLGDFRGKKLVLYFYPKADTPGCTREAEAFRDRQAEFAAKGAVIVGVSPDTPGAQRRFCDKYELPFKLLADEDAAVAKKYGVWQQKTNFGRTYMGVVRSTFIIDEAGVVCHVFPNVRVDGHAEEVLAAL